jgi:hypothetical protein
VVGAGLADPGADAQVVHAPGVADADLHDSEG